MDADIDLEEAPFAKAVSHKRNLILSSRFITLFASLLNLSMRENFAFDVVAGVPVLHHVFERVDVLIWIPCTIVHVQLWGLLEQPWYAAFNNFLYEWAPPSLDSSERGENGASSLEEVSPFEEISYGVRRNRRRRFVLDSSSGRLAEF